MVLHGEFGATDEGLSSLPVEVPTGVGTALFVDGSCRTPLPIRRLEIVFDGVPHPAMGWEMAEPGGRTEGGYWWGVVPVPGVYGSRNATVELLAELIDGSRRRIEVGETLLVRRRRVPELASVAEPRIPEGPGPAVAICMATYEPDLRLFRTQIESIRAQSHGCWVCVISDDASSPVTVRAMREIVGSDGRFAISSASRNEGLLRNFERALLMVPDGPRLIAFSDQDDRWYPDKLETLITGLSAGSPLVYSDMRIVSEDGSPIADTYWTARRNNRTDFASMFMANSVTGAASLFDAAVLERALPFPPRHGALFHDHWIAQVAMTLGSLSYVPRALHDYVQHDGAALGHYAANGGDRFTGSIRQRAAAAFGGFRARGYRPAWRAPYFNVFCRLVLTAEVLRARCDDVMSPAQRRVLERVSDSPSGMGWLAARSLRGLWGADETLGRERAILAGFAWRRVALARRQARRRLPASSLRRQAAPPE